MEIRWLIIIGGLVTLVTESHKLVIEIWLPIFQGTLESGNSQRWILVTGLVLTLTGFTTVGSILYALKRSQTGFILLGIGACLLFMLHVWIGYGALYYRGWSGGFLIALPGIVAIITLLLASYDNSEKIRKFIDV